MPNELGLRKNYPVRRNERGCFVKGFSGNPKGRPKGAVSRLARLREDFLYVYGKMGGHQALLDWAKNHPSEFYVMLFKLVPKPDPLPDTQTKAISYEQRLMLIREELSREEE